MALAVDSRIRLNKGVEMPVLGLGTAMAGGDACVVAVRAALDLGYRLIDTASMYGNEREVGAAIRESDVPREDIFLTTKVGNPEQGYESTLRACDESLRRLQVNYVDLYLIHWPARRHRLETWRAMVELLDRGRARAIGVSNYMVPHLEEVLAAGPTVPAVNQIELSPFLQPADVVEICRKRGIVVEAYSPLTRGRRLNDRRLRAIAAKYGRSPAQILLRWGLQHGLVMIPKSSRPDHIRENANVFDFEIRAEDMAALDALDEQHHMAWDPTGAP
jgi:diketogulonate reductase-like aldo/keto reductase